MDGIRKEHNLLACIECDGIEREIDKLNKAIEELLRQLCRIKQMLHNKLLLRQLGN